MDRKKINAFKEAMEKSNKIVVFTGAGISTESGISDYRSKGGIWDRFQPVYFDEFISDEKKRIQYWENKIELWDGIKQAEPNRGHMFVKELYDKGKLFGLITQNIDGLHEKSGLPGESIVNLHGTNLEVICLKCEKIITAHEVFDNINLTKGAPLCEKCSGLLKPNTISFGQQLRYDDIDRANRLSSECDMMIAIGSTLVVQPAAGFPALAKNHGALLSIITLSETPYDSHADFVFNLKISDFLDLLNR